jgi:uncharacterized protein (DUF983 family)
MIEKGSKLYSVVHGVCPRCQKGKVFKYPTYHKLNFTEMNEYCAVCALPFVPEPDFYQGAMYVSYGLSTALFLIIGVVMLFYFELGYLISFLSIGLVAILLLPVTFRLSRLIWINIFVNYRPSKG